MLCYFDDIRGVSWGKSEAWATPPEGQFPLSPHYLPHEIIKWHFVPKSIVHQGYIETCYDGEPSNWAPVTVVYN